MSDTITVRALRGFDHDGRRRRGDQFIVTVATAQRLERAGLASMVLPEPPPAPVSAKAPARKRAQPQPAKAAPAAEPESADGGQTAPGSTPDLLQQ